MAIITREPLTKKLLMDLEIGAYVISNIMSAPPQCGGKPVFAEEVRNLKARQGQWERIKAAHVNGKLCVVFPSRKYYFEYMLSLRDKA